MSNRESTSIRLRKIMEIKDLRQIDIVNMVAPYCEKYDVKINKADISQYLSGRCEPTQAKLYVLCRALNVQESWLMGFDVPMTPVEMYLQEQKVADLVADEEYHKKLVAYTKLDLADKILLDSLVETFLKSKGML